jgi:predicted MFS family arabinose efflux permease
VAAGVTIGLSIGLGGVGTPLLGLLADSDGLRAAFYVIAGLPLLALALTWALPRGTTGAARAQVSVLRRRYGQTAASAPAQPRWDGQESAAQRRNQQRSAL